MIDYIKGVIEDSGEGTLTVENSAGMGYLLNVSENTLMELAGERGEVKVYSYMAIRENDVSLYGFATKLERELFLMLITVPKIGPRIALNVLSAFSPEALVSAVVSEDVKMLTIANGIGKKAASTIVVTLHDKMEKIADSSGMQTEQPSSASSAMTDEAVMALVTLGFDNATAMKAVRKVDSEGLALEDIIAQALRSLDR